MLNDASNSPWRTVGLLALVVVPLGAVVWLGASAAMEAEQKKTVDRMFIQRDRARRVIAFAPPAPRGRRLPRRVGPRHYQAQWAD